MSINLKCRIDLSSYIEGTFVMSNFSRSGKENCLVNGWFNKRLYSKWYELSNIVIFWTEFSCWCKSYSVEVITTTKKRSSSWPGWPLPNIHISNANEYFTLHVCFSVLYPCQELYPTCHIWVTQRVHKNQELLFLRKHFSSFPVFMVGSMLLIFLIFLCRPIICLPVLCSVLWCPLQFPH
jgi:hypothetical protein